MVTITIVVIRKTTTMIDGYIIDQKFASKRYIFLSSYIRCTVYRICLRGPNGSLFLEVAFATTLAKQRHGRINVDSHIDTYIFYVILTF